MDAFFLKFIASFLDRRSVSYRPRAWPSPTGRLPGASEDLVTAEDRLHVVFGTGEVGTTLAAHLADLGLAVRAVSRHRPPALAGVDWRAADAIDPEAAADAAKGASVVYQ